MRCGCGKDFFGGRREFKGFKVYKVYKEFKDPKDLKLPTLSTPFY